MSIRLMADVYENGPDDPTLNSVLLRLAFRANDQGGSCFPSVAEICQKIRRSESTVIRSIAQLEHDGWITVERGSGKGNVSQYKLDVGRLKGCHRDGSKGSTVTPKGAPQRVSPATPKGVTVTAKGVTDDKPPTPPLVEEPSENRQGNRHAREARPVPPAPEHMRPVNPDAGAELESAVWFFHELAVPSDFGMRDLAAQAIRIQAEKWGGVQASAERILKAAKDAKANGETRWRFWFTDQGYLENHGGENGGSGKNHPSPAKQRVDGARRVLAKIAVERGLIDPAGFDGGTDAAISEPGSGREHS